MFVVAAPVLRPLVEPVELAERPTQRLDLCRGHTVEVDALLELAVLVAVLVGRAGVDVEGARRYALEVRGGDLGEYRRRDRAGERERGDLAIVRRAAVVDPVGDEGDLLLGDHRPAPRQARELRAVERRLTAQPADQARGGAATWIARLPLARCAGLGTLPVTAAGRSLDLAFGRDHPHPMDHRLE